MNNKFNQQEIVNYLKNYGFIYPNSEIYNGLANAWDFGPLGVLLKNNIKQLWWKNFITCRPDIIGLDTNIIYNPEVWVASGHLANFSDPLIDCKKCKTRWRADKLIEDFDNTIEVNENDSTDQLEKIIHDKNIKCPNCGAFDWTNIRKFNLMFKTFQGVVEDDKSTLYLRPETAQGIFINFKNVLRTSRMKLPFGIGQIGKAFRNEITPGNFIFRTREFEQMEIEYFIHPQEAKKTFEKFINDIAKFLSLCNIDETQLKKYNHPKEKLSHYSSMTTDYQFNFPHGWAELCGIAHRGNYDLTVHSKHSGKELDYLDLDNTKFLPDVIEPSIGVERLFYAIIVSNYDIEKVEDDNREILRLPIHLCPYKFCVLPLTNKLKDQAHELYLDLLKLGISMTYDASGTIGKRYRRQDAIGTMYCITFDFDSIEHNNVTIRHRDTMKQETININELKSYIIEKIYNEQ